MQDIKELEFDNGQAYGSLKRAFDDIFSVMLAKSKNHDIDLSWSFYESPIGTMIIVADNNCLYLLEFAEIKRLEKKINSLTIFLQSPAIYRKTKVTHLIEQELKEYFAGKLKTFYTPYKLIGSPFNQASWQELIRVPYGETRSYLDQAAGVGSPNAYRAVANTNAANRLAIIIPCHRIINHNGRVGGYAGGLWRKKWLLDLERNSSFS